MTNKLLISILCLSAVASVDEVRADDVSDRVFLVPGGTGCPTGSSFRRITQYPDGTEGYENSEFQVPVGKYLEITSVEYTTPLWTVWAKFMVQSIDLSIRKRGGTTGTTVLSAKYHNQHVYRVAVGGELNEPAEVVGPGANTHFVSFPSGPLMGPLARLCLAAHRSFWQYGGDVRVRGRLIPSNRLTYDSPNTDTRSF